MKRAKKETRWRSHILYQILKPSIEAERLEPRTLLATTVSVAGQPVVEGGAGGATAQFAVTRTGDLTGTIELSFATADGTAHASQDYIAASGTYSPPDGQPQGTIPVSILGDSVAEPDESFILQLNQVVNVTGPAGFASLNQLGSATIAPLAVDLNSDGRLELLTLASGVAGLAVYPNTSESFLSFGSVQPLAIGSFSNLVGMAAGDFNVDGRTDVALTCGSTSVGSVNFVAVLLNTTAPGSTGFSFAARVDFPLGSAPRSIATADINLDGRTDVVVSTSAIGDNLSVLLNQTTPGASAPLFPSAQSFVTSESHASTRSRCRCCSTLRRPAPSSQTSLSIRILQWLLHRAQSWLPTSRAMDAPT